MADKQLTEEDLKNMSPEELAALQKQNCIFCHIISGKIPAKKVYEDEQCIAILDINPASKGHILLLPKEHYAIMPQMPDDAIKHISAVTKKLSAAALRGLQSQGTNIFIANGAIAGQRAPHVMVHIIPRYEGDALTCFEIPEKTLTESDKKQIYTLLSQRFGRKPEQKKDEQSSVKSNDKKDLKEISLKELKEIVS
ncbi:MAG TPA: HIT domain-containing protein [Candidatus Nanoarchaeia archaeon]|nr:HIT domain-containing protein [Candidatus Nanoarchaeia archaeon]